MDQTTVQRQPQKEGLGSPPSRLWCGSTLVSQPQRFVKADMMQEHIICFCHSLKEPCRVFDHSECYGLEQCL